MQDRWRKRPLSLTSGTIITLQNKANPFLVALSTKNSFSKSSPFSASKKQSNTPQVDLSSKLASNGKLTSDKHKKHLKNNLCLYYGTRDHKLNSCPKDCSASATADTLAATSEKPLEK